MPELLVNYSAALKLVFSTNPCKAETTQRGTLGLAAFQGGMQGSGKF